MRKSMMRKRRIRKALKRRRYCQSTIVDCGGRPTLVAKGMVLHAPFCGRDSHGKAIYIPMTKKDAHALARHALGCLKGAA